MSRYFLLLLLFFCLSAKAIAQDCASNPANLRENRCEGYADLTVSAGFHLVAMHASRIRKYEPSDWLYVHFYQPEAGEASVKALNIRNRSRNYKMEANQHDWQAGWQAFGPWPVAEFLAPEGISMSSLGLEVVRADGSLLPAYITNSEKQPEGSLEYRCYFSTPTTIKVLHYEVRDAAGKVILADKTEDEEAQSIFSLKLPMPESAPAGQYQLHLEITWINGQKLLKAYPFIHSR